MFEPLKNKVVIKRDPVQDMTGILHVPKEAQEKEIFGTVIAVGDKVIDDLFVGQRVFFGKIDGVSIDESYFDEPGDYIIVSDEQIRGIINA